MKMANHQHILLNNGSTLVLYGNLYVNADEENKVKIEGMEPKFGSIISINNKIEIENLIIKNLTSPSINGYVFYKIWVNLYPSKMV